MKKRFIVYGIVWAIALGVFNTIAFVIPHEINGVYRLTPVFWISYAFVTASFVGQLACGIIALKPKNNERMLYRIPLIKISYGGVIAMAAASAALVALASYPYVAAIVCAVIFATCLVSLIRAGALASIVEKKDAEQKERGAFMDELRSRAVSLSASAPTQELKSLALSLAEEIRYSDTTSSDALSEINERLSMQMKAFGDAVGEGDKELARENAASFLSLLKERNELCKLSK